VKKIFTVLVIFVFKVPKAHLVGALLDGGNGVRCEESGP